MHEEAGRRRLRGAQAIAAALADGAELRLLLCPEGPLDESVAGLVRACAEAGVSVQRVSPEVLGRLGAQPATRVAEAEAGSGQDAGAGEGLLALVGPDPAAELEVWLARRGAAWLLTGTAYPGNAGFVVRSAEVSGADGVVIDADFGRDARRECLRAAMRADRFFPVCFTKAVDAVAAARRAGRRIIAVEDSGDRAPWELDLRGAVLFVVGGERQGIPQALLGEADAVLRIPMAGFVPSYNLQAAMAVVMGERLRQLGGRPDD
ncbi:MAG: hypothetical protein JRH19_27165 [Deltaproteobacteria bacterium]|nr:hypothetical protein [Deltaproteobacteria bacterium]